MYFTELRRISSQSEHYYSSGWGILAKASFNKFAFCGRSFQDTSKLHLITLREVKSKH
jgi:hypothetical protein